MGQAGILASIYSYYSSHFDLFILDSSVDVSQAGKVHLAQRSCVCRKVRKLASCCDKNYPLSAVVIAVLDTQVFMCHFLQREALPNRCMREEKRVHLLAKQKVFKLLRDNLAESFLETQSK